MLTSTPNEFIGLKITSEERKQNRVEISHWKEAGLKHKSYVQCDYYSVFQNDGRLKYIGSLKQVDYDKVVRKFNEFYPILEWMK